MSANSQRRPEWLKIQLRTDDNFRQMRSMVSELNLNTVCTEARCPNIYECWNNGTATFMILGETCTRRCGFCSVHSGRPDPGVDPHEPEHVAEAVERLGLKHAVITSVDRDDLPDGGAAHFRNVLAAVRRRRPECALEILTPDFKNKQGALEIVMEEPPEVFSHNIETVPRLYREARPGSKYEWSKGLLRTAAEWRDERLPDMRVKSSMMLGLGETDEEVFEVMEDLCNAGVQVMAIGQYLQPTKEHMPVARFVPPADFERFREKGREIGLLHVEAGPLVRSSYHAEQHRPDPPSRDKLVQIGG